MNKKTYTTPEIVIVETEATVMADTSIVVSGSREEKAEQVLSNKTFTTIDTETDNSFWKRWADKD